MWRKILEWHLSSSKINLRLMKANIRLKSRETLRMDVKGVIRISSEGKPILIIYAREKISKG